MHILILPSWYPTKEDPVSGSFFAEQAEALARFGHRVSVFALFGDALRGVYAEKRIEGNLTEYAIHFKPLRFHLTVLPVLQTMRKLLRSDKPDIIHVHSFRAVRYARLLKGIYGIPFVVTEHVSWFERGLLSEKTLREIKRGFHAADAVYAVSPGLKNAITPYCRKEITVIPNLVSDLFFEGEWPEKTGERFGIVTVGGLSAVKRFDRLIRAFAKAAAKNDRLRLTICGDGEERAALEALAGELDIRDKVTFTGRIDRETVASKLRENDLFALSGEVETFGVVYIEAMACGLPIVMGKTAAWERLVSKETGLTAETEDELAAALLYMAEHRADYDPETIREYCWSRFSASAVCRRLTEEYEKVLCR